MSSFLISRYYYTMWILACLMLRHSKFRESTTLLPANSSMKGTPLNYMYVQSFLIKYILLLQIPVFAGWSSSPFSDPVILSKILITDRFMNKLYYMLQDTHFKASNTEPLIYRFGLLIFMQMWWEYLDLLNVGKHLFKFSDCCKPYGSWAQTRSWLSWSRYSNIYYQTSNRQRKRVLMYVPRHIFKRLIQIPSLE